MKVMITLCLSTFFIGQTFPTATEVKEGVRLHLIETRRKLFLAKNDKVRIRVTCLGRIPMFTLDGEWPGNTEEVAPTKKRIKVKGKKDVGLSDPVGPNKKGVSLGGRGRPQPLAADECPWALQITKSREIHACTSKFLSKGIVEQIEKNPNIYVKALQDELQKKYELGVSREKAFRAKSASLNQVKVDYSQQDLLGLNGAFMKGPYPGQLLTAIGLDGNNVIYPLAYAIMGKETTCSWTWFLECLGDDLGMTKESNFTFITIAMANVFPCADYRYCLRHIYENMKKQWNGQAYKELLSHFSSRAKSDILLNNLCECFNGKILDARDASIIKALEYIRQGRPVDFGGPVP
ncbi:hypothetical protein Tco_1316191 [Tanacetum coccineum]